MRSRRDNLVFHGLPGSAGETWEQSEEKVREFMSETLHMGNEAETVLIARAHRINPRNSRSPVIAKFLKTSERSTVFKKAREILGRDGYQRVTEDFTQRVREDRRSLSPWFVKARDDNKRVKMRQNKLIIDGSTYMYDREKGDIVCVSGRRSDRLRSTRGSSTPYRDAVTINARGALFTSERGSSVEEREVTPSAS
ncbi:uncharacterized protein LOC124252685 [Haliotis rubra]|uniref:uncharacterized protein LOC124252685 n=1 Tax=Haliotis rubra TaxID=36100 RepID=UPI001EE51355|nr:uncharacterized protein LOC124252685 [Haliotis rubra]